MSIAASTRKFGFHTHIHIDGHNLAALTINEKVS